jgi:hypothetical protein
MKRRSAFGYIAPPKSRAVEMRERTAVTERLDNIARQKADAAREAGEPLPSAREQPKEDTRSVAERIGLQPGYDLDAELDRRGQAVIADPNSAAFQASTGYAQRRGEQHDWSADTIRLYALFLRSVDLPRPRQTSIYLAKERKDSDRPSATITTYGRPGSPPEGWATFLPANINAQLILGLPPSQALIGPQWTEAARLAQAACDELEQSGCLEWQDRGSRGLLKL